VVPTFGANEGKAEEEGGIVVERKLDEGMGEGKAKGVVVVVVALPLLTLPKLEPQKEEEVVYLKGGGMEPDDVLLPRPPPLQPSLRLPRLKSRGCCDPA